MLNVAIIGVGSRGGETYGRYMNSKKDDYKITSLCEIKPERLAKYQKIFDVPSDNCFIYEKDFFQEKRADLLIVSTQDQDHVRHALKGIELGYNILLEKPISANKDELLMLAKKAEEKHTKILVCHVLRYQLAFKKVKSLLDNNEIGKLISIDHLENVTYWHQAHSFVRGNWRNEKETSPMILAKCCHDLDLLVWYSNSECDSITSFGKLNYFKKENAPYGAALRCLDCQYAQKCPYSAYRIYIERWKEQGSPENAWPYNVLTDETLTESSILNALKEGPYGRCVYHCDNDVVDSQSTSILFKNGVTANLKMTAFNKYSGRYIHFFGTEGEIIFDEPNDEIRLFKFGKEDTVWKMSEIISKDAMGHGGGDSRMLDYLHYCLTNNLDFNESTLKASLESHFMALAAEESRLNGGKIIKIHN